MLSPKLASHQRTLSKIQSRHQAITQIERTMNDLVFITQELDRQVNLQDLPIQYIERNAEQAHQDLKVATVEITKAKKWAERVRRHKWMCAGLVVLIIIAIAVAIAVPVCIVGQAC